MTGGALKYVEMEEREGRDEAARPRQAAETGWFKVITFGCAPREARPAASAAASSRRTAGAAARGCVRDAARAPVQAPQPAAGDGVFAADCFR